MNVTYSLKKKKKGEKLQALSFFTSFTNFFLKKSEKIKKEFKWKGMKLKSMWRNNTYSWKEKGKITSNTIFYFANFFLKEIWKN